MKDAPVKLLGYQKEYNARKGKEVFLMKMIIASGKDCLTAAAEIIKFQAAKQHVNPDWLWHPNECQLPGHPDQYDDEFVCETQSHMPESLCVRVTTAHVQYVIRNVFHWAFLGQTNEKAFMALRYYLAKSLRRLTEDQPAMIEWGLNYRGVTGVPDDILSHHRPRPSRDTRVGGSH
jgi:hypothetical protein